MSINRANRQPAALRASVLRDIGDALAVADTEGQGGPLALVPDFAELLSRIRTVLTIAEIATATGVRERQVHHWAAGTHQPQGSARDQLIALHETVNYLLTSLSPDQVKVWLWSHNDFLAQRPFDCLARGEGGAVAVSARELSYREEVEDVVLIALAKEGNRGAYDRLVRRYHGFVRLKASSYFLAGGDSEDLVQEGLVGLYKAIRDFRTDRESSFRNFAELCITRQIVIAVKTATRNKHTPLNQYVSFSSTDSGEDAPTLDQMLPGPTVRDPVNQVISSEELRSLVDRLSSTLSELESKTLSLYLDGCSYQEVGERLSCNTATVEKALQRVKRKVRNELGADSALRAPLSLGKR